MASSALIFRCCSAVSALYGALAAKAADAGSAGAAAEVAAPVWVGAADWVGAPGSAGALAVQPDSTAASVNIVKPAAAVRRCRCLAVMVSPK